MEFSLAVMQDLAQLKSMYKEIIKNMNENGIQIWDDIYPCEFFEDDIKVWAVGKELAKPENKLYYKKNLHFQRWGGIRLWYWNQYKK